MAISGTDWLEVPTNIYKALVSGDIPPKYGQQYGTWYRTSMNWILELPLNQLPMNILTQPGYVKIAIEAMGQSK